MLPESLIQTVKDCVSNQPERISRVAPKGGVNPDQYDVLGIAVLVEDHGLAVRIA